jgi:hypothetical protein
MNAQVMNARTTSDSDAVGELNWALVSKDQYQEEIADRVVRDVFKNEENAEKTGAVIWSFVESYEAHKATMEISSWLVQEFRRYPELWRDEAELQQSARDIISEVESRERNKAELQAYLDREMSQESWLAKKTEQGAQAAGVAVVTAYAKTIDSAIETANRNNWDTITRMDGQINQSPNLDGFIAEHHHANTFNIDAAAKGGRLRAEVLKPAAGEAYGKNSVDIVIRDENGKIVNRYQSKYGADAQASEGLFGKGDYRGQQKLVPEGQSDGIEGKTTETIEAEGVSSKPLSKEEAKELQRQAQEKYEAKLYEWRDGNRMAVARHIGKQALLGACITAGFQGSRILGRRIWNRLTGKANRSASDDLREFFESSITSAANTGVQVAVSGGLLVACRNGWLGAALKNAPAGHVANIAMVGMEGAKALYKFAKGEITGEETLDAIGRAAVVTVTSVAAATEAAALGASIGAVLGPVGATVGGFVGAVAGGIAGCSIGETLYEGGKAVLKTAGNVAKSIVTGVSNAVNSAANWVGDKVSSFLIFS